MTTLKDAQNYIEDVLNFRTDNLDGRWIEIGQASSAYVVSSYGVEIARREQGGLRYLSKNAYDHSVTTSRHANIVARAWNIDNYRDTHYEY